MFSRLEISLIHKKVSKTKSLDLQLLSKLYESSSIYINSVTKWVYLICQNQCRVGLILSMRGSNHSQSLIKQKEHNSSAIKLKVIWFFLDDFLTARRGLILGEERKSSDIFLLLKNRK